MSQPNPSKSQPSWMPRPTQSTQTLPKPFTLSPPPRLRIGAKPTVGIGSKRKVISNDAGGYAIPHKAAKTTITHKDCAICLNRLTVIRFPQIAHSTDQNHGSGVCTDCWKDHLASHVHDKEKGPNVQCAQCNATLEEADIKRLADPQVYNECVMENPKFRESGIANTE